MKSILLLNFRQMIRSKFILFLVISTIAIQVFFLKVASIVTGQLSAALSQQMSGDLIRNQGAVIILLLHFFSGGFLAFCFGTFYMPYLHTGSRATLTYCQPIPKIIFPLAYTVSLNVLQLVLVLSALITFGVVEGFPQLSGEYPWTAFLTALLLELIAFSAIALLGGVLSIRVGRIVSFLLVSAGWPILSLGEVIVRNTEAKPIYQALLYLAPPVGKLPFHLYELQTMAWLPFLLWTAWLAVLLLLFQWILRAPLKASRN